MSSVLEETNTSFLTFQPITIVFFTVFQVYCNCCTQHLVIQQLQKSEQLSSPFIECDLNVSVSTWKNNSQKWRQTKELRYWKTTLLNGGGDTWTCRQPPFLWRGHLGCNKNQNQAVICGPSPFVQQKWKKIKNAKKCNRLVFFDRRRHFQVAQKV